MAAFRPDADSTLILDDTKIAEDLLTLRDCLRWATSEFYTHGLHFGHGTASPWDEAVALTLGALHLPWDVDPSVLEARLLPMERHASWVWCVRASRRDGRCLTCLERPSFAGVAFNVDERVLIPRSPIAELIEDGFAAWFPEEPPARVLDLCCGSGCIGIATALHLPTAEVDLADISTDALEVAKTNITRHDVGARVRAVASDVFDGLVGQRYDLIVSNPPYVDAATWPPCQPNSATSRPWRWGREMTALDIVRRILREARSLLSDDGVLIVEVGNSDHHLEAAFPEVPFLWLEFERGGQGVFVLTAHELDAYAASFA